MRLAFIVMAVLNLAFFAWQYPHNTNDDAVVSHTRLHVKDNKDSIILLHEREAAAKATTSAIELDLDTGLTKVASRPPEDSDTAATLQHAVLTDATRRAVTDAGTRCYSVGPFASRDAGQLVAARLQTHSNAIRWRSDENVENLRYWVTYVANSADDAQLAYDDMQGRGLHDVSIMSDAPGNVLSLGLFRGESTANRRLEEAQRLGYHPTIRKQYNSRTNYWLDVEEDPQNPFTDKFWNTTLGFTHNIGQRSIACR